MARKKKIEAERPWLAIVSAPAHLMAEHDGSSAVLCSVNPGTQLVVHQESGEWSLVSFGLVAGWIRTDQIER